MIAKIWLTRPTHPSDPTWRASFVDSSTATPRSLSTTTSSRWRAAQRAASWLHSTVAFDPLINISFTRIVFGEWCPTRTTWRRCSKNAPPPTITTRSWSITTQTSERRRDGRPRATRTAAAHGVQQLVHHPEEHLSQHTTVQDNMLNNIPSRCIIIDYIPAHYCGSPYPSQSQQHRVKSYTALQCWCTKIFHCQANLNHDRTSQHWLLNLNNFNPSTRLCRTTPTLVTGTCTTSTAASQDASWTIQR